MSAAKQLLEIQPNELKFVFELRKQSSCSVRLVNNSFHNVAFKVKTTSPKKYCVRPNVGIINQKSTCEFTVTMQAQKVAPPDMVCKDKFLIQSTVVPVGTTDEDITPIMFSKDSGKYIEEVKMRVALLSPPESPVPPSISPPESPVLSPINGVLKRGPFSEASLLKDHKFNRVEITPRQMNHVAKDAEFKMTNNQELNMAKNVEFKNAEFKMANGQELNTAKNAESRMTNGQDLKTAKNLELKPKKDVIHCQESKLENDADLTPNIVVTNEKELKLAHDKELKQEKSIINDEQPKPAEDVELPSVKDEEFIEGKAVEELKLTSDIEEMKSKLHVLESKLNEAESTISKLTEERRQSSQERKLLQEELEFLRSKASVKRVYVGFPLLFVVMIALVSIVLGYLFHP